MLCTESVWFWNSEQFAEKVALGYFYLSFGFKGEKINPVWAALEKLIFEVSILSLFIHFLGEGTAEQSFFYWPLAIESVCFWIFAPILLADKKIWVKQWYQRGFDNVKRLEISQP